MTNYTVRVELHRADDAFDFLIGATPSGSNRPAMETFLRKHNVIPLDAVAPGGNA